MSKKQIYYTDPLNDDFARTHIVTEAVDSSFVFVNSGPFWNFTAFLAYYGLAMPIVWTYSKLVLGVKIKNRTVIRKLRRTGFFLYGNHTQMLDAFIPPLIAFPTKAYTICNADAVSIHGIRQLVLMLGGLPIPTNLSGMPKFLETIRCRTQQHRCIAVYPEAHIWPFYTGIRPFASTSFRYPAKLGTPVVAMTTTYRKRRGLFRFAKKPGMTLTVSEPMWPDMALPLKQRQEELRDRVYTFMCTVAADKENVEYIHYEHRDAQTAVPDECETSG